MSGCHMKVLSCLLSCFCPKSAIMWVTLSLKMCSDNIFIEIRNTLMFILAEGTCICIFICILYIAYIKKSETCFPKKTDLWLSSPSDCYHFTSMIWTGIDILIHGLGVALLRVMVFALFPLLFSSSGFQLTCAKHDANHRTLYRQQAWKE